MILTDAGPLVAIIDSTERAHEDCVRVLRAERSPLGTVWPAFTEAMYLLGPSSRAQQALWEMVACGALTFLSLDETDAPRMRELMRQYADLPMDLADAALVRVGERERLRRVFTLDKKDFQVYRPKGLGRFSLLP
ncbi:MAG: PIN domain-containing protein [Acidobacteriota bacterium]